MPTWIIDPAGGGDYTSISAAVAAIPSSLSETYRLQLRSTTEFVASDITIAERTMNGHWIVFEPAPGFGFAEHQNAATNPLRYNPAVGVAVRGNDFYRHVFVLNTDNVEFKGLQICYDGGGTSRHCIAQSSLSRRNLIIRNCIIENTVTGSGCVPLRLSHATVENTLVVARGGDHAIVSDLTGPNTTFTNCMIVNTGSSSAPAIVRDYGGASHVLRNCAIFGYAAVGSPIANFSGSHNATNLASVGFGTNNLTNLSASEQFENTSVSSQDWRTKSGSALIGAGAATGATATDIILRPRPATPAIGVWDAPGSGPAPQPRVIGGIVTLG